MGRGVLGPLQTQAVSPAGAVPGNSHTVAAQRKSSVSAVPECTGLSKVREGDGGMADTLRLN